MKLLLHIGTGKTGSTSIQGCLQANADRIRAQGVYVPAILGERNHRKLPAIVQKDAASKNFMVTQGIKGPGQRQAARDKWKTEFLDDIAAAGARYDRCIITAEHLSFLDAGEIEDLKALLSGPFQPPRILVYLRDPIDYEVSMYDTALKVGGLRPGPRPPEPGGETDYRMLLEKWAGVFGVDALDVRIFDRRELLQGDIVADFAQAAGLDTTGFACPDPENPSLDLLGKALLTQVNRKLPRFLPDGRPNPRRRQIHRMFERHFATGPKYTPDPELVAAYRKVLAPSNEWVRSRFFPDRPALFAPRDYPPKTALSVSPQEIDRIADLVIALWTRK
ncbi:hypothetical protein [uncultured Roseovarius sp.]|uniref:hypothetical protein n=1 Tax=uncultured Roseovarius sp. TaxID=293344 RepID=UPI0025926E72|nr:hypothetical protein [uncultured Roseovarius sp.]